MMTPNIIHAAIVGAYTSGPGSDFIRSNYVSPRVSQDILSIRGYLLGSQNPRDEQRNFASLILRRAMLGSQLRQVADSLGSIEDGFDIPTLIRELTDKYIPVLDEGVVLSPAATKDRTRLYTLHRLEINVDAGVATVNNPGFGITSGNVNTPIRIPGLSVNATVRVVGVSPIRHAEWATAPSYTFGQMAENIRTSGVAAIRTISTIPGSLSEDTRQLLREVVLTHPVYVEVAVAAALLLTNAVIDASL